MESKCLCLFVIAACDCSSLGTVGVCNPSDGKCTCKRFVMGARCDRCQVSFILSQSVPPPHPPGNIPRLNKEDILRGGGGGRARLYHNKAIGNYCSVLYDFAYRFAVHHMI